MNKRRLTNPKRLIPPLPREEAEEVGPYDLARLRRHQKVLRAVKDVWSKITELGEINEEVREFFLKKVSRSQIKLKIGNQKRMIEALSELRRCKFLEERIHTTKKGKVGFYSYSITSSGEDYLEEIERILADASRAVRRVKARLQHGI